MRLSDFDYELPQELIAQRPLVERDGSRMMVLERRTKKIYEKKFTNIVEYLIEGDALILNDARVIPARLTGKKETGARVELFLLEAMGGGRYKVLARPSKRLKKDSRVIFDEGVTAEVLEDADFGKVVQFSAAADLGKKLRRIGKVPLPPYIKRDPEKADEERYQTVYARSDGATASPTAGLHFTKGLLSAIKDKGVNIAYITLDVSYGTFAPVLEEEIERHRMHKEYYKLPEETAEMINETKKRGNKIVAVGTTAARVLETGAPAGEGFTDLFIYPGYKFKAVDALLTNFHIPKSTLLMLVSAFAGRDFIMKAYRSAVEKNFRFFSYGDCMLII
ncbi:MAG: tRNA preQ1(34) S-adenosylmethionine ribosyltransferase-isomerase QueA [Candidatus Omnitrophica bacterium]|nr:tRNA preQ1(34) S-adenosylmethionine ribosyltransferase-isomerase QueA [Candidatus Omnitrophota bacterium]